MRIAAAALAASIGACGTPEPAASLTGCAAAYQQISDSLLDLHAHAGKPVPELPDRTAWIAACEGLSLTPAALRCLDPAVATAETQACEAALDGVDRSALDQPFLDTMLPKHPAKESP